MKNELHTINSRYHISYIHFFFWISKYEKYSRQYSSKCVHCTEPIYYNVNEKKNIFIYIKICITSVTKKSNIKYNVIFRRTPPPPLWSLWLKPFLIFSRKNIKGQNEKKIHRKKNCRQTLSQVFIFII